jgi:antitoxin component YwqK of YwqJK toxin-antitoxin module
MFQPHIIEDDKVFHEILFYESGKISQEQYWVNYALIGNFRAFHENGKLKTVGQFETEQEYFSQMKNSYRDAVKVGKWSFYDNTGRLEKEEFYELNKLVKTLNY